MEEEDGIRGSKVATRFGCQGFCYISRFGRTPR